MEQLSTNDWVTGWTATDAPQIGFAFVRADADGWEAGPWPGLQSMELDLGPASDGLFSARRIRVKPGETAPDTGWYRHDGDFDFIYVLSGSVAIETEAGEHCTLGPGASGLYPALTLRREYGATPDLEYIRVTVPGELPVIAGRDSELPARAGQLNPGRQPVYTFDLPETYVVGAGPRSFFEYRDLGTASATAGRIHIHVVHAVESGAGTGWHYHSMAQWFLILEGSADIAVEEEPIFHMGPLDSMCVGRGMRHDVVRFSSDYKLIEMCVPADYETVGIAPPQGSASSDPAAV
jgi:mannose-6-phosphate isomerase-like protein (cupin superfamily)